jgi:hypothetical protein
VSLEFIIIVVVTGGWDSSVGIETCYMVSNPMFRPPVGARFSGLMQKFPEEHTVSCTMVAGLFSGDEMAGVWRLSCTVGVEGR